MLRGVLVFSSLVAAVALSGFEQGTYFVVDLVDGVDAAPAAGRIAVEASSLQPAEAERSEADGAAKSEFFIGLGTERSAARGSAFEVPGVDFGAGDSEEEKSFGDFGTETESDSGSSFSFE